MSVKAKLPKEDPETVARREAAEQRAEAGRIEETQEGLSADTRAVIRQFGRLAAFSGQRSIANLPNRNSFAGAIAQRNAGAARSIALR
jgi:hypothetical protein